MTARLARAAAAAHAPAADPRPAAEADAPRPGRRRPLLRSYKGKFLIAAIPTVVVLNLLVATLFSLGAYDMVEREVAEKHRISMLGQAAALSDTLWNFRFEQAKTIVAGMAADREIAAIRVIDETGRTVVATGRPSSGQEIKSVPIAYSNGNVTTRVGTLEVHYAGSWLSARVWQSVGNALLHTFISTLTLGVLVIVINQRLITEPLTRLTRAIRSSQADGQRQRVEWNSDDELGELVATFNDMQARLDDGEKRRRSFNERLMRLYNRTPAMLHSVDREGSLIHVSDHWLIATGYSRRDVIGRKLASFLTPDSAAVYTNEILTHFVATGETPETPLRLRKADGGVLDVVLAETVDMRIGGRYPLSLSVMSDISRMKAFEREMRRLALTDPVTGLANRRGFVEGVDAAVARLERSGGRAAAVFIDLDRFKRVNDTWGHAAGDLLLVALARRLADAAGPQALAGRLGGDEFAVFVPDMDEAAGHALAERLLAEMRQPVDVGPAVIEPSGSVGVAAYPGDGGTGAELLMAADLALYRAKQTGRNRVERFEQRLADALIVRQAQEQDVRAGLARGWFEIHVQPIVRLATGRIVGGEALIRLRHPERGLIEPGRFIPVAEESGLIEPLGRFVLQAACELAPKLVGAARDADFFLSINLSGGQVNRDLPAYLARLAGRYGLAPRNIVLEIMETALLDDADEVNAILSEIAELGIRFALDDFGTGYSSLNYVDRFPVSMIKVDRSFTRALGDRSPAHGRTRALVRTTVTLGHQLGLPIVAEGIERPEEMERMIELGVDFGQGYHFAPPMPADDFLELLAAGAGRALAETPPLRRAAAG